MSASKFIEDIKKKFIDNSPRVILEVGSRDLDQSIEFTQAFPNARVIAFEPNPEIIDLCRHKQLNYPNIELYEYAISDQEGIIDFYVTDRWLNAGASSMLTPSENFLPGLNWKKISGIQSRRLDSVLTEIGVDSVDIVWMDVQGVELRALKSMGKFLENVKMIHTEAAPKAYYQGHILKNELEDFLTENNFNFEFIPHQDHLFDEGDLICIKNNF
jgi:FkbM family methyltransferase